MDNQLDVAQLFDFVTQALGQKRAALNAADGYNHDHGDHVLEVFQVVTQVARENPNLGAADILARASQMLSQKQTGTARAYAQTMAQGAQQLKGKPLTQQTLPLLIQAVLGAAPAGTQPQPQGGGLLGGLLGALMGGGQQGPAQGGGLSDGLGLDDLMRAGSALLQASQSGGNATDAALSALAAATGVGQTPHRAESAKVVVQALLQAAQQMGGK